MPLNKHHPVTHASGSRHLILGNGASVRKKARREYDQAKKKLDQARLEITRFKTEDCPAFDAWLHRTFGQTLTELRELNHQYQDKAQLMMEVEDICFTEQVSIGEAYRLALHRRAHPEEMPPPPKSHADAETKFRRKSANQEFPPDEDDGDEEGFAEFAQAFADIFGDKLPPGLKPPSFHPKPNANSRVKKLYRILVRKLHPDAHGQMTPETAALCLLGLVIVMAVGRSMGSGLIGTTFRVGIPVLSIAALALRYADNEREAVDVVLQLCSLGLLVFGIYLMVSGLFAGKRSTP